MISGDCLITRHKWFESDKKALCEYAESLGIAIEVGTITEGNYGEYHENKNLIRISSELIARPKHMISTLIHEISHHYETELPRERLKNTLEEDLLSEYLAGAIGLILYHHLHLEMPVNTYIDFNAANLRNFLSWAPKTSSRGPKISTIKKRALAAYDSCIVAIKDYFGTALSLTEVRVIL